MRKSAVCYNTSHITDTRQTEMKVFNRKFIQPNDGLDNFGGKSIPTKCSYVRNLNIILYLFHWKLLKDKSQYINILESSKTVALPVNIAAPLIQVIQMSQIYS